MPGRRTAAAGAVFGSIAAVAGVTALDWLCAGMMGPESRRKAKPLRDYSSRSGIPQGAGEARAVGRQSTGRPVSAL
jgi:hypothetical protein